LLVGVEVGSMSDELIDGDVSVSDMMDNMANPEVQAAKKVDCPIDGCSYDGEPESVSGHVSASSQDDHIWSNTRFNGWKHFNREMRNRVEEQLTEARGEESESASSGTGHIDASDAPETESAVSVSAEDVEEIEVPCPIEGCEFTAVAPAVASHLENTSDGSHKWDGTRFDSREDFFEYIERVLK